MTIRKPRTPEQIARKITQVTEQVIWQAYELRCSLGYVITTRLQANWRVNVKRRLIELGCDLEACQ